MRKIVIYGAGGFGKEIHQLIDIINNRVYTWDLIGFIDDEKLQGSYINGIPVLGGVEQINLISENVSVVFAFANPVGMEKLLIKINNNFINYPNLIHPDVYFDIKFNEIGIGNIITQGCLFTRNIFIGNFNIFNTRVCVGHDVTIGDLNVFQPNVQISGNVKIGNKNYWGVNSIVLAFKKIGNSNTIGAASLLINNITDSSSYFGVPAMKQKF